MRSILLPLLFIITQVTGGWSGLTQTQTQIAATCKGVYQPAVNAQHSFQVIAHEGTLFEESIGTDPLALSSYGIPGPEQVSLRLRYTGNVWARVYAPTHFSNSFWLQLKDAAPLVWNLPVDPLFQWVILPVGIVSDTTLTVSLRESGVLLDAIAVLPPGCRPNEEDARNAVADTPFNTDSHPQPDRPWDVFDQYWLGYGHPLRDFNPAIYFCDRSNLAGGWWHNWTAQFVDVGDITYLPMHWGYAGEPLSWLWPYNDGRPLLLLNEPDIDSQANLRPQQAADKLKTVLDSGWKGDIYFGGFVHITDWAYIDAIYDSFETRYGPWPDNVYNQIHVYTGTRGTEDMFGQAESAVADVRAFIEHQRALGRPTRTLITELGALSAGRYRPADYAGLLLGLTERLREIPDVVGAAWYVSCYGSTNSDPAGIGQDSSLIEPFSDRLTPLGRVWNLATELP